MARRRRAPVQRRPPKWETVRGVVRCSAGEFIPVGDRALFFPWRPHPMVPRKILCETHAKQEGHVYKPFTFKGDALEDHRARRAGDE